MRRSTTYSFVCLALLLVLCSPARADTEVRQGAAVNPRLNAHYKNGDVARWRSIFERPGREVFDQRFRIMQAAGVSPGMVVADVGAGTGLFTFLFARAVGPAGKVYAVDISESFLAQIQARALEEYRVTNVETILNDQETTGLPPDSVDLVFMCDTYHHLEYPRAILDSLHSALRDGGELVLIDFRRIPGQSSPWVMAHVRAGRDEVVGELRDAGFVLVKEETFLRENYFLRFRKRAH